MLLYLLLHSLFFSGESESCTSDWNLNHGLLIINKITHLVARLTEAWVLCISVQKEFSERQSNRFSSVQFSCSVMSDSLQLHESQHSRPPCPSPTPRVHSYSHPVSDAIQPCHPLSFLSPPAPNPSQHQSLFQ